MSPAEEIRVAAKTMRERAEAVLHLTPPWRVSPPERGSDEWLVGYSTDNPLAGLVATTPDYGQEWIAEHIASWHPGVALAVAGWLDMFADPTYCYGPEYDAALRIARAYLGGQPASKEADQ